MVKAGRDDRAAFATLIHRATLGVAHSLQELTQPPVATRSRA